jgi:hypothetical protein
MVISLRCGFTRVRSMRLGMLLVRTSSVLLEVSRMVVNSSA